MKKYAHFIPVLIASLFVLWGMHFELYNPEIHFSDGSFHLSVLQNLDFAIRNGRNPLDFWYAGTPFGFALFRSYQYFPYIGVYGLYLLTFKVFTLPQVFAIASFSLVVFLPWSFYIGLRAAGLEKIHASFAGLLSVLISDGGEFGFGLQNYVFGTNGLYTQLWAMAFLPLAIGYGYRWIEKGECRNLSLLFGFLTFGCHVVGAFIVIFSLLLFSTIEFVHKRNVTFKRVVIYFFWLGILTAHQWVFVFQDALYINQSSLEPAWKYNGRGISYILDLIWNGTALDKGRFPFLTILFFLGVSLSLFEPDGKSDRRFTHRSFLATFLFLSLYAGREVWGWLFADMPALKSLHMHRFAIGFHFYAIILMSAALFWIWKKCQATSITKAVFVIGLCCLLWSPFQERKGMYLHAWDLRFGAGKFIQANPAITDLLKHLDPLSSGPIYAGATHNWDSSTRQFGIPVHFFPTAAGYTTVGGALYHAFSLSGETLFDFDVKRKSHFELYGIQSVIAPSSWEGMKDFRKVATSGALSLWNTGLGSIHIGAKEFLTCGNRKFASDFMRRWVQSPLVDKRIYGVITQKRCDDETLPIIHFDSAAMKVNQTHDENSIGKVVSASPYLPWKLGGSVDMQTPGIVIASTGYHPNWIAKVDGKIARTLWVTPGFLAVDVEKGVHSIDFEYQGSRFKIFLLLFSIGFFIFHGFHSFKFRAS